MDEYSAALDRAHLHALDWLSSLEDRPVPPQASIGEVTQALDVVLPNEGSDPASVVDLLADACDPGLTAMGSGRFFGFVIGGTHPAALAAEKREPEMSTTQTTIPNGVADTEPHGETVAELVTPLPNDRALFRVASVAAFMALAALMVGVAMALTSQAGTSTAEALAAIATNPWPFLAGGVGLALVSLFDLLTIPALHAALGRYGRVLILLASAAAVIGDVLGIIGRLAQTALVPIGLQTADLASNGQLAAGQDFVKQYRGTS